MDQEAFHSPAWAFGLSWCIFLVVRGRTNKRKVALDKMIARVHEAKVHHATKGGRKILFAMGNV